MATQDTGECMICGVESTECCSSCKKHGTRIFFCSNEHQKLMWVLHREFCGPKSHPFRLPPLTETEAAKAWTDRHTVITDENGPLPDLVKMAQTYGGMSEEEFERIFPQLSQTFSPGTEPEKQQDRLHLVRNMISLLRKEIGVENEPSPVPPTLFALGILSTILATHFGLTLSRYENERWYTPLMHRFCALTVILLEPYVPPPAQPFKHLLGALMRIAALVKHEIKPTDPALGMLTLQRLVPFLFNEHQRRLVLGMDTM